MFRGQKSDLELKHAAVASTDIEPEQVAEMRDSDRDGGRNSEPQRAEPKGEAMATESIATVPNLPDSPPVEAVETPAPEQPAVEPQTQTQEPPLETAAPETPPEQAARGNFDAGLQRLQREHAQERAEMQVQITNLTTLVSKLLDQKPNTPTAEQIRSASVTAAEKRANDLVASIDQQIAAATPDSESAMILKGQRETALLLVEQAKSAREEIAQVRTEAKAQVQEVAQQAEQATVWTRFDANYPHLAGKGPAEWQKIVAEGKAEGIDPTSQVGNAILSDRFIQRAKASKHKPVIAPLRPRPSGSAPSAQSQPGARIPTEETDQEAEQRERAERDRVAQKFENALGRYQREGGVAVVPAE